jgi:AcrR family transcriptional regulator
MTAPARTPRADARVEAQRQRILAAAQECFVERGFHAASMAAIAETAEMSAGLIYRYFKSKNEIILAIIEHQLEVARIEIAQLHASTNVTAGLVEYFEQQSRRQADSMNAALMLEMSAEATRDPQIVAALGAFDATIRSEIGAWLGRSEEDGGRGLPLEITQARALMFMCVIDGLNVRVAREPTIDRVLLRTALSEVLAMLLKPPRPPDPD